MTIDRSALEAASPLTSNQERLFFLYRLAPESVAYNLPFVVELRGPLDVDALGRALDEIVRRHDVLRSRFVEIDGAVRRVAIEARSLELGSEPLDAPTLEAALEAEGNRPFDLERGPTARFRLFHLGEKHHALVWTVHHIVFDIPSYRQMLAEIETLYPVLAVGGAPEDASLPTQAVSFAEHARRERAEAEAGASEAALDHWRRRLAGLEPLELPLDHPRPAEPASPAEILVRRLSPELTAALRETARARGRSTVFAPTFAAYTVLLRALSDRADLAVGVADTGRSTPDVARVMGFFIDLLAVRVDLGDDPTFGETMDRLHAAVLDAKQFPHPPLDRLADELTPNRRMARNPFFQTTFQLVPGLDAPSLPGLETTERRLRPKTAKFDLGMDVYDLGEVLDLEVEIDAEILDRSTVERWLDVYVYLLEQAVERPDARLSELTLATPRDLETIRRANDTATDFPGDVPLFEQFRRRAESSPAKSAVVHGDTSLPYSDLLARAEALADRLTHPPSGVGVGPGDFVGLVAQRALGLVEGMLGILAAGGAYVSLDPDYPEERLRFMIDDAGIRVLLVEPSLRKLVPPVPGVSVLDLASVPASAPAPNANEEPKAEERRRPARTSTAEACLSEASSGSRAQSSRTPTSKRRPPEGPRIDGDFPACLIYTSGSTGTPKASVIPQRGVTRLVVDTNYATFGPDDVFSQTASPSFDAAIFEIWGALLHGGTLVVVDRDDLLSSEALERTVKENQVSVLFLTTAYFQQIARQTPSVFETTRAVFFGGERCEVDAVRRAAEICARSGTELFHAYGPSECTTYATVGRVEAVAKGALSVPVGGPIANTTARVVDAEGRQVPVGVPGELWLGGPGLAQAYHRRPGLTADRFVPDPFSETPGARLYRTGDRVRWLERGPSDGGTLDFLGRVDHQVKIRGFRIEPGEIEAVLARHPAVAEALVMVLEDEGDKRLVAYAVLESDGDTDRKTDGERPDGTALRDDLAAELPDYMVPSVVMVLDAFPLTANGKIDRRALPAPEIASTRTFRAPASETETILAATWSEVLGVERVGLDDDFFTLGGHSLLAVRLVSRIREHLGVELTVREIFRRPRLEDAVRRVDELLGDSGSDGSVRETTFPPSAGQVATGERDVLSFGQERLYFLQRLDPDSAAYNMPFALRLVGPLDRRALEQALGEIVRRHEILRTRYVETGGTPRAIVDPPAPVVLDPEPVASEMALDAVLARDAREPFDLAKGALRLRLFTLAGGTDDAAHVLLFDVHHIAFDGWSHRVVRHELATLYEHFAARAHEIRETPLPEPPLQYADHAAFEHARLAEERLDAAIEPWRERLAGLEPLDLPADRPRVDEPSPAATRRVDLPAEVSRALRAFAREHGTTLFTASLAAFDVLLQALTGRDDLAVGVPDAGRNRREIEEIPGFFVDHFVLRADLSGDPTFAEVVRRVHERVLDAREHGDAPFGKIVERLAPARRGRRNPFFDVTFQVLGEPSLPSFGGLEVEDRFTPPATAKFDLSVDLVDAGDGPLRLDAEWATLLFDDATVERWLALFVKLLESLVRKPERRLSSLDLLLPEDEALFARGHVRGEVPEPHITLPGLFAERARERGDALAAVYPDGSLSYRQLDSRARVVARVLARHGVRPGDLVGSAFGRSIDLPVSMLGIGYAGAAYVPLDPEYPRERLAAMIDDAGLDLVVHLDSEEILPAGVEGLDLRSLDFESLDSEASEDFEPIAVDGEFPAYVLYTSGSTGRPKGAMLPHRAVVNLLADPLHDVGPDDVMAQIASPSFDVSGWEIWLALTRGARLLGVERDDLLEPDRLRRRFEEGGVTFVDLAAAVFHEVAARDPELLAQPRRVFVGAERMDPTATRRALAAGARLVNAYGPTETAIDSTFHSVESLDPGAMSVPIGRGVPNVRLHVVDRLGRRVPPGVEGELWIGGPALAHGYFRRPSLTAAAFVPDPFGAEPGGRLYRTGDRVRWLPSGVLDFRGRVDRQVKIRGHRVEPGEVEAALAEHPAVRHAAVVAQPDAAGHLRLVAWAEIETEAASERDSADLREFLRTRLPAHAVPSIVQIAAELPRTPSGKIDRKALPDPDFAPQVEHVAPRDETEARLASIWAEVLGFEGETGSDGPSVTVDFFDLGGHSLLATRLVARVDERFGVRWPVRRLFELPTIEAQARALDGEHARIEPTTEEAATEEAAIEEARERGVLSFGQRQLFFLQRLEPESAAYNMPLALRLEGALDRRALERALDEILRRHAILRTRYEERDGEPRAVVDPPTDFRLEVEAFSSDEELDEALQADARTPFDLAAGPVVRVRLFALVGRDSESAVQVLLFNIHHVAFDGWSYGLLRRELAALYEHFAAHPDASRDETAGIGLPTSIAYAEHAAREHAALRGDRLDALVEHWRQRLDGVEPLDLPTDRPRRDAESPAASRRTELPAAVSTAVRRLARERGTTLFITLLAGFDVLLQALTGRDDLVIGAPDAGRDRRELEDVIGFFVDHLVLRVDLSGDPTFTETLERAQESVLDAHEHADLPFDKLVEELSPERRLGRNPFFDISFQVLEESPAAELPGLATSERSVHPGVAKFDLSIDLVDPGEGPIRCEIEWAADLFDESTVERWTTLFAKILEQVATEPDRRLSTLDLETAEDVETARRGHRFDPSFDPTLSLAARVARKAAERADAVAAVYPAAVYPDERITYRELDRRARVLAKILRRSGGYEAGVKAGDRVGLCLPRSIHWPVAALGVAYAGAAYVPLDPDYPRDRLAFMVEDAKVKAIVGRGEVAHALADEAGVRWVALDELPENDPIGTLGHKLERALGNPPPVEVDGEFPAYVIYTSGSTGRPKGVVVPHRAVANSALDPFLEQGPDDALTQGTSPSFDVAAWEMWSPLATGGKIVGFSRDDLLDLGRVRERVEAEGVTVMELPGPLFAEAARVDPSLFALPRWSTTGGDRCDPSAVRAILAAGGRPINYYGPTETAINVTFHPVEHLDDDATSVPIGKGVRNAVLRVLDPLGRPVPTGVAGELFVGGPSLAHGYLDRPALTAAAFVPDPFAGTGVEAGARLYRTGDRVRRLPTGDLDFLGRVDEQLKIRGFRVEPGEIEAILAEHPAVRHAAVEALAHADAAPRLFAWVEIDGSQDQEIDNPVDGLGLRAHLADRLPEHMVPAGVEILDALPRTPNGKVDRKALRQRSPESLLALDDHVAPRDATEAAVAEIWAEVLRVENPSVRASFFELGGHSLLAIRLVARLRARFGVELAVRALFDHPTIAELSAHLATREAEILDRPRPETSVEVGEERTLSFGQRRLWFLHRLDPESTAYGMPLVLRLRGPLDARALGRAITEVIRRHEILRTRYVERDGEPRAKVDPPPEIVLEAEIVEPPGDEATVRARLEELASRPYDLEHGPIVRPHLLRAAEDDHRLLFDIHHVAYDGWSHAVVLRELSILYPAFLDNTAVSGETPSLPDVSIQYAEHAARQVAALDDDRFDEVLAFWRAKLDGLEPLELPMDHPRPAKPELAAGTLIRALPAATSRAVRALGRARDRTTFSILLAGFQLLLERLTGRADPAVGVAEAGRPTADLEDAVGFFVDMLTLRADLADDPSFETMVDRAQESLLDAREHADAPFERLVEALAPERHAGRTPIFQVTFQVVPEPEPIAFGDLVVEEKDIEGLGPAKFDLSLGAVEGENGLHLRVRWAAEIFDRSSVERWLDLYVTLLDRALADLSRRVSTLDALPAGDAEILARGRLRAPLPEPTATLPGRFAEQAARRGDALAAVYPDGSLSYRELDRRARALARELVRRGVRPGDRVGSAAGRSIDLPLTLVAIGYAGAAYVPLDPEYPRERLAAMIEDAGLRLVIGRREIDLPAHVEPLDPSAIVLDSDFEPLFEPVAIDGEFPAYVLYTSGSTGRPKGVVVPHRALLNMLADPLSELGPDDVMTQMASPSFDVSGREVWLPLTRGARILGVARDDLLDPAALRRRFEEGGVTVAHFAAVVFHEVATLDPSLLALPRRVFVGADRLDPNAARRALDAGATLVNAYGPTEVAVDSTFHAIDEVPADATSVPIGRPVQNLRALVLDRHGRPAPVGVEGELFLGGVGLAHGYAGRPALTAAAFVPDPEAGTGEVPPGARLYRTGDRVRVLPSGAIDFRGRVDQQVKIRGHRVEPGEIEAVLAEHPAVRHAAVVARPDSGDLLRLVAWAEIVEEVALEDVEVTESDLFEHLRERLPDYMVPAIVKLSDALPRTPSGKIDRKALRALDVDLDASREEHVVPRTAVEASIAAIWADVLGLEDPPSVAAGFFELGGHSLLATRLVVRIREHFEVDLPVRRVFDTPTIAGLALAVEEAVAEPTAGESPLPAPCLEAKGGESKGRNDALSFGQRRLFFLSRLEPESTAYNMLFPTRLRGPLDVAALDRALAEIVNRHQVLRTRIVESDGDPRAMVDPPPGQSVGLGVEDLSGTENPETEAEWILAEQARSPFDLEHGPTARWRLLRLAEDDHVFVFDVHHAFFDGVSHGLFRAELTTLYAAFRRGEASPLSPLPLQFSDHAADLRERLDDTRIAPAIEAWRRRLEGLERVDLPADRPRSTWAEPAGATIVRELPGELSRAVRELARSRGHTLFTVFLAAYDALLHQLTGATDLAVGTAEAGRSRREVEDLLGFFVDMLVLRTDLSGDPSFEELVERAQETLLDAREHAEVPFDKLVEALHPDRQMGRTPFFQTVLQVISIDDESLDDLAAEPWPVEAPTAKFDLHLAVGDRGGRLDLEASYAADLFEPETVERWLDRFVSIVEQVTADPSRRLSRLDVLSPADAETIRRSNDVATDFPGDVSLYRQFRERAAERPDHPAVVHRDASMSWGELAERTERLGRRLIEHGVGPGDFVGLCVERGVHLPEGMLGILAAGAAYVPLDPDYPEDRLRFMIEDTGMRALVATPTQVERLPALDDLAVLHLESSVSASDSTARGFQNSLRSDKLQPCSFEPDASSLRDSSQASASQRALPRVDGDFPAYVIYTSGSTGKPKGVIVPQRGVTRLVRETNYLDPGSDDVVCQSSSPSFDATTFEIWAPLLNGGTIAVIDRDDLLSPDALLATLERHGATILFLTTAYFQEIARRAPAVLERVRAAIFGGERCEPAAVREAAVVCRRADTALLHAYGPTEATVYATVERVGEVPENATSVPIGGPIANTTLHVVDASGREVGVGVLGELWIGGPGVAHGYHRRPGLTAERFVPNPFVPNPSDGSGAPRSGARAYRTGDLVRRLANGTIDFLGRIDHQVKIRGFRIEPGEIEAVLARHPHVGATFVTVREDRGLEGEPADRRLVAYATPAEGMHRPGGDALRLFLAEELPDFLVPAAVVVVDAFPLTPNGKVDARALPAPEIDTSAAYRAPETPLESFFAETWAEILGVGRVGLDEEFFALGGHSLLAVKVFARLEMLVEVSVPLALLFDHPRMGDLACAVEAHLRAIPGGPETLELLDELASLSEEEERAMLEG